MVESIEELRRICQSSDVEDDPWILKFFFRKISIYFTELLLEIKITANQVTLLSIFLLIITGLLFIPGNYWYSIIGALLLQLFSLCDCVDGEIARYMHYKGNRTKMMSLTGKYLEQISHATFPFIYLGLSFYVYNTRHDANAFILGFLAGFSSLLYQATIPIPHPSTKDLNRMSSVLPIRLGKIEQILFGAYKHRLSEVVQNFFAFPCISLIILLGAIANSLIIPLILYGIALPFLAVASIYLRLKWISLQRQIDALG